MDHMLHAIADPARREMLELLRNSELASSEIAAHFKMTHSAVSQHLRVLLDAGLVQVRKEGTRRLYRGSPEGLAELRSILLYLITTTTMGID
jgi:DNA-binding transcriptional ArsR family regulator